MLTNRIDAATRQIFLGFPGYARGSRIAELEQLPDFVG